MHCDFGEQRLGNIIWQDTIRQRRSPKLISSTIAILGGKRIADDPRSELEIFAGFFHQDFDLCEEDAYEVARRHFNGISSARQAALKSELIDLLELRKSKKAIRNAWRRLGGASWQSGLDLRAALHDFVDML